MKREGTLKIGTALILLAIVLLFVMTGCNQSSGQTSEDDSVKKEIEQIIGVPAHFQQFYQSPKGDTFYCGMVNTHLFMYNRPRSIIIYLEDILSDYNTVKSLGALDDQVYFGNAAGKFVEHCPKVPQ